MEPIDRDDLPRAFEEIVGRVRRRAEALEREGGTLDASALVAEAYKRLEKHGGPWKDRAHLYRTAVRAVGQALSNDHRDKKALKRGGGAPHVTFHDDAVGAVTVSVSRFLDLDRALEALGTSTPDLADVVRFRYFAGLPRAETAAALGVSEATVKRKLRAAHAFLARFLSEGTPDGVPPDESEPPGAGDG